MLVGEAVNASLAPGAAGPLHRAWVDALRRHPQLGPRTAVERTAVVARHLLDVGDVDAAVPALLEAAAAAIDARAFAAADASHRRAIALAGDRLPLLVPDLVAVFDNGAQAAWLAGDPIRAVSLGFSGDRGGRRVARIGARTAPSAAPGRLSRRGRRAGPGHRASSRPCLPPPHQGSSDGARCWSWVGC